jgi:hypothetical protein
MAARDHSEISIKSPKCGLSGIADTSTGDHPYMKSDEFRIHKLPEGFVETKHSKWRRETEVMCTNLQRAISSVTFGKNALAES